MKRFSVIFGDCGSTSFKPIVTGRRLAPVSEIVSENVSSCSLIVPSNSGGLAPELDESDSISEKDR